MCENLSCEVISYEISCLENLWKCLFPNLTVYVHILQMFCIIAGGSRQTDRALRKGRRNDKK